MRLLMQMSPIQRGLEDRHPYVRRTAVMGVLKVYNFDEAAVQHAGGCRHWQKHGVFQLEGCRCDAAGVRQ